MVATDVSVSGGPYGAATSVTVNTDVFKDRFRFDVTSSGGPFTAGYGCAIYIEAGSPDNFMDISAEI